MGPAVSLGTVTGRYKLSLDGAPQAFNNLGRADHGHFLVESLDHWGSGSQSYASILSVFCSQLLSCSSRCCDGSTCNRHPATFRARDNERLNARLENDG